MFFPAVTAALVASLSALAHGQDCVPVESGQYTGTPITNSLPAVPGSELTFFKIADPTGQYLCSSDSVSDLSLINQMSLNTTGGRPPADRIQRAVIVIHGLGREPYLYQQWALDALAAVTQEDVNTDTVAVMTPHFANGDDKGRSYPWNASGETLADRAYTPALVWYGAQWIGGSVNNYPPRTQTVSGFDVIDQIVQWFGDTSRFPNMKQIVVAGHSAGAMMVQRYVAVGKTASQLGVSVPISYWIGDPSSHAWLDSNRPLSTSKCAGEYDFYRDGFADYGNYGADKTKALTYQAQLVGAGPSAIIANFQSKAVNWAHGTLDFGDKASSCAPYTTGKDRNERFFNYINAFRPSCPDPAGDNCDTVDHIVTSHDGAIMLKAEPSLARLFTDNWNGDGARAYDYGYPRQTDYDDPYPDPTKSADPLLNTDTATYAGGSAYKGCYTDADNAQTNATLSTLLYTGDDNTRASCVTRCVDAGYNISGVRDAECYCGDDIASEAVQVVSTSCNTVCPGDNSTLCGGTTRISIFATSSTLF